MAKKLTIREYTELVEKKIKAEARPLTEKEVETLEEVFPITLATAFAAILMDSRPFIEEHLEEIYLAAVEFRARGLELEAIDDLLEVVYEMFGDITEEFSEEEFTELNSIRGALS